MKLKAAEGRRERLEEEARDLEDRLKLLTCKLQKMEETRSDFERELNEKCKREV